MLQQLALEAKRYPLESKERQLALHKLISMIWISPHLGHPMKGVCPNAIYEDLRNEAILRVMGEIARKIDGYKPEHPVMKWVNGLLGFRFRDVWREHENRGITGAPRRGSSQEPVRVRSLDELTMDWPEEAEPSEIDQVRQFIEEDPEQRLTEHIRGRPEATLKVLFLAMLDGLSWKDISESFNPPIPKNTIFYFVDRNLRTLQPYLQKHLCE